ncbi:histone deacetylase family protein [Allopusillimonas ginsengisoli]|uniref:histone deacetylase family protein n=1 Tax=Allopusillimonas ginsengisoli TaxID=453575 RepID=UPI0010202E2B|nr:histone deacetylase family protein [Allopusillimonas ginsengisoli]TEA78822.1 histone deacetylase family protein [Allopusillimonas ginsengisoli]
MHAFFSPDQMLHDPRQFMRVGRICEGKDLPQRTQVLLDALSQLNIPLSEPKDYGLAPLEAVHAPHYLRFLKEVYTRWRAIENAGPEVLPNVGYYLNGRVEDDARPPCRSTSVVAQAAYYLGDLACPVGPETYVSAVRSAHSAVAACEAVMHGESAAYALCRPSGHHAHSDRAAGFCYVNNAAVAAQHLRSRFNKVATLDVDTHHGDGTQQIFYRRQDVLTISVHADPIEYYPYQTGYADETGHGQGEGCNLNLPLAHGTGNDALLEAVDTAAAAIRNFGADVLVLSLGFDAHRLDPLSVLEVNTDSFYDLGQRVRALNLPTVVVQEGGYAIAEIGGCLHAFLRGFLAR